MEDDFEVVNNARKLLVYQKENQRFEWHGEFISLSSDLHLNRYENKIFSETYSLILKIVQDIGNIRIILERLEWMRQKSYEDEYLHQNWAFFASVDIEHFFVELRSIMDYVAEIIVCTAKKRGQIPKSFESLKNWVKAPGNRTRSGGEISDVIESAKLEPKHIDSKAIGGCSEIVVEWMDSLIQQNSAFLSHNLR